MSAFEEQIESLSPKRLKLLALELRRRLDALEGRAREPVAIVGMGCRFPGGANDAESYWRLLHDGVDAVTEVPADRFDVDMLFDPDPDVPGKLSTRYGAFLEDVESFDPQFFGMAPREAAAVDPQQRLLLEVAWEALEDAAQRPEILAGTAAGVFVGIAGGDQHELAIGDDSAVDAYTASGSAHSVASGRLAYTLGLQGPAISIDTACSSSLVAVHLAVQSLRSGECRVALAGGVNAILAPRTTIALSKAHMMAPDGRCKAFDARADGFVRGEGCGLVVLKRLSDAVADGDRILSVILGSAVNQDGRSAGLSAPNGPSQEAVVRAALADAGAAPGDVGYVEAHGTGTALGDPIEVQALGAALCSARTRGLAIGSVKTNIGHLEAAAGVAGLVKAVLALQHRKIPPHLHLGARSPHIPWDAFPTLEIPTEPMDFPQGTSLAGVSSFGFSGTNAHVVLGPAPPVAVSTGSAERRMHVLPLSAHAPEALEELAPRYAGRLRDADDFADVCYTAGARRAHHAKRLAVCAASGAEAAERLTAVAEGRAAEGVFRGEAPTGRRGGVAFLFPGQGSQHAGMGRELFELEPSFRATLERCDEILADDLEHRLLDVLYGSATELLGETAYTQPALVAVEVALAELWRSWGITPSAVLGHSVGEIAAACVAGALSLDDALRLAATRGRLMQATPPGAMAAVFAGEPRVRALLAPLAGSVDVAAVNGPSSVTIAGAGDALDEALAALAGDGITGRRLDVARAFHSQLLEPALPGLAAAAGAVAWSAPELTVVSNLTGRPARTGELADPGYWRRHAREPVRFHDGMRTLLELGVRTFLEAGPAPTLLGMARRALEPEPEGLAWLPALRPDRGDLESMLTSLAEAYAGGADVDWEAVGAGRHRPVALPAYPFRRQRFPVRRAVASAAGTPSRLQILGSRLQLAASESVFESQLGTDRMPFLAEHTVHGAVIVPSPAYIELALAAVAEATGREPGGLDDLVVHRALAIPDGERRTLQTIVAPGEVPQVRIAAAEAGGWTVHASARIVAGDPDPSPAESTAALRERIGEELDVAEFSAALGRLGFSFGPRFRAAQRIWRAPGEALGLMAVPAALTADRDPYRIHPALLDACLHLLGAAVPELGAAVSDPFLLVGLDRLRLHGPVPERFLCHATLREQPADRAEALTGDVRLVCEDGAPIATLSGVRLKRAPADALLPASGRLSRLLYDVVWRPCPRRASPEQLLERLAPLAAAATATHGLAVYDLLVPQLDTLCGLYAARALERLGLELAPGESFEQAGLAERLGVEGRHARLLARLADMLVEDGVLELDGGCYMVRRRPDSADPGPLLERLRAEFPACDAELAVVGRTAPALTEALRGDADPLDLLFPGASLDAAERLYGDSPAARAYGGLLAETVAAAVEERAGEAPVRILEVGAGTGGSTVHILERLAGTEFEYTFTDVSPLFTSRAAARFGEGGAIRYALLDVGDDAAGQGFAPGSFDVVVCANVLHATPDLRRSLRTLRSLLVPGGLLLVQEATGKERFGDVTVGLTEGWWAFADDVRADYALLPVPAWLEVLAEEGFGAAVALGGTSTAGPLERQAILVARNTPAGPAHVVAVAGPSGLGAELAAALAVEGVPCSTLAPGDGSLLDRVRDALRDADGATLVHLAALERRLPEDVSPAELEQLQRAGLHTALETLQGALAAGGQCRLVLVTAGAQPGDGATENPIQAGLWGLARVVRLEHPELACTSIDLAADAPDASALTEELLRPDPAEPEIALRRGRRLAPRLVPAEIRGGPRPVLREDASYLVTGGLGGLGLACAERLAELGARTLVLAGRRPPSDSALPVLQRLEAAGVRVQTMRADVSVPEEASSLIALARSLAPLAGVVHAAGSLEDAALVAQTWERFERVAAAKVAGTLWLDQALAGAELDFLCLFSSGAGLLGSPGQANHASANAFLDAYAAARQGRGAPAVSIAWGPWSEIGAAADRKLDGAAIAPADGLAAFELALRTEPATGLHVRSQLAVLPLEAGRGRSAGPLPALLAELASAAPAERADRARHAEPPPADLPELLAAAPPGRALRLLENRVQAEAAAVLGLGEDGIEDLERPLPELGLDSLMAVELRNRLAAASGRALPATLLFEYPTVALLAAYLASELGNGGQEDTTAPAPEPAASALEGLSETEVAALLERKLDTIAGGQR